MLDVTDAGSNMVYLYVKQHSLTKLQYFGKTTCKDPYKYLGSGLYWKRHLKKYGSTVITKKVWSFNDHVTASKFALTFSIKHNIVKSTKWANLRIENSLDGTPKGTKCLSVSAANRINKKGIIPWNKGKKIGPNIGVSLANKTRKGKPSGRKGKPNANGLKGKKYPKKYCPYCNKLGGGSSITRYHFNNCKDKI